MTTKSKITIDDIRLLLQAMGAESRGNGRSYKLKGLWDTPRPVRGFGPPGYTDGYWLIEEWMGSIDDERFVWRIMEWLEKLAPEFIVSWDSDKEVYAYRWNDDPDNFIYVSKSGPLKERIIHATIAVVRAMNESD